MSALDKWEQSHNIDEFTDFQIVEMLDAAAAENDELRLALKVSIVCNAEQKSWGEESPFQKRLDGLVGKFEHEKVNRDDIAEGYCSYCETPLADVAAAREHGKICEKHPLRAELDKKDVRIEELDMALKMMHFGKDDR